MYILYNIYCIYYITKQQFMQVPVGDIPMKYPHLQWAFQEPKSEILSKPKAYARAKIVGISPQIWPYML